MAIDQVERTVLTQGPTLAAQEPGWTDDTLETGRTVSQRVTSVGPGSSELTRRIVVLVFGLIQIAIGLRVVLLLLNAREANGLVSAILNISQVFVAPFNDILSTDALAKGGSVLDVAAIVAFVGWTIVELIVLWAVGIFRRQPV